MGYKVIATQFCQVPNRTSNMNQQTQTSWIQASTGKNQEAIQFAKYTGYWSNQSDDVTELEGQDMGNVCMIKLNHLPQ